MPSGKGAPSARQKVGGKGSSSQVGQFASYGKKIQGQRGNEDGGEEGGRLRQKDAQSFMRMTVEGDQMTEWG